MRRKKLKKSKFKESNKEAAPSIASAQVPPPAPAPATDGAPGQLPASAAPAGHDDATQDLLLLKRIISQALGEEHMDNPEAQGLARQAYQSYTEMGYPQDQAIDASTHSMKLAGHLGAKSQAAPAAPAQKPAPTKESDSIADQVPAVKEASSPAAQVPALAECNDNMESGGGNSIKSQVPALDKGAPEVDPIKALTESVKSLTQKVEGMEQKMLEAEVKSGIDSLLNSSGLASEKTNFMKLVEGEKDLTKITEKFSAFRESIKSVKTKSGFGFAILEKTNAHSQKGSSGGFSDFA